MTQKEAEDCLIWEIQRMPGSELRFFEVRGAAHLMVVVLDRSAADEDVRYKIFAVAEGGKNEELEFIHPPVGDELILGPPVIVNGRIGIGYTFVGPRGGGLFNGYIMSNAYTGVAPAIKLEEPKDPTDGWAW